MSVRVPARINSSAHAEPHAKTAFESGAGIDSQLSITRCGHRASQAEEVLTDARAELERLQGKRQKASTEKTRPPNF